MEKFLNYLKKEIDKKIDERIESIFNSKDKYLKDLKSKIAFDHRFDELESRIDEFITPENFNQLESRIEDIENDNELRDRVIENNNELRDRVNDLEDKINIIDDLKDRIIMIESTDKGVEFRFEGRFSKIQDELREMKRKLKFNTTTDHPRIEELEMENSKLKEIISFMELENNMSHDC